MGQETRISELVELCLASEADGTGVIPFGDICADDPGLQGAVESAYEAAKSVSKVGAEAFRTDSRLGTLVADRYRLEERLGAGAMGIVYEAMDLDLSRMVAIKLMRTDLLVKETTYARFEREATTLAAVRHESVVTVYDRGVMEDGTPYLVMEKVEGVSCSRILEEAQVRAQALEAGFELDDSSWLTTAFGIETLEEPSFLRQVVRWAADVASGLAAAHDAGVIHRDLKPSNIIIQPTGRAVLIDFGIASARDLKTLTGDDEIVGTPAYMPPEALKGSAQLGPEADVYGLAATLYHLITLQAPFEGSLNEILSAVASHEPTPASRVRPGIPRDAEAILEHGMARVASSRYVSLSAMEQDLRALLAHRPVSVRVTSNWVRMVRRVRRSRVLKGAVGAALLILVPLAVRSWRADAAMGARLRYESLYGQLPTNQGIQGKATKYIPNEASRLEVAAVLDGLADSSYGDQTVLALRALFRFDHGDLKGAATDMQDLADRLPGKVTKALAAAYFAAADSPDQAMPDLLIGLPLAESRAGLYLTAIHMIRARQTRNLGPVLNDPRLDGHRHSEELRLGARLSPLARMREDPNRVPLDEAADNIVADARRLVEQSGFTSAMISHVVGTARLRQSRYEEALEAYDSGLAHSPHSLALLQNGAEAALSARWFDRATDLVGRALERAPEHLILHQIRANIILAQGRVSEAREIITNAQYPDSPKGRRQRSGQFLKVLVAEAALLDEPTSDEFKVLREEANEFMLVLPEGDDARVSAGIQLEALASGDKRPVFRYFLAKLLVEPTSLYRFDELLKAYTPPLSDDDEALLFQWLIKLGASYEALAGVHRHR